MKPLDPFDDSRAGRTTEDRRDEIVDKRLSRGMMGMAAGLGVGVLVVFVEEEKGLYLMAGSLALIGTSMGYLVKTLVRRKKRSKRRG